MGSTRSRSHEQHANETKASFFLFSSFILFGCWCCWELEDLNWKDQTVCNVRLGILRRSRKQMNPVRKRFGVLVLLACWLLFQRRAVCVPVSWGIFFLWPKGNGVTRLEYYYDQNKAHHSLSLTLGSTPFVYLYSEPFFFPALS